MQFYFLRTLDRRASTFQICRILLPSCVIYCRYDQKEKLFENEVK